MLAKVKIYKGIEFIELNDLPSEQAVSFRDWAPREAFIKILIKDNIVSDCIQYKYYRSWYKTFIGDKQLPAVVRLEKELLKKAN